MFDKFKPLLSDDGLFYGFLIILVALSSFGLGRLSTAQHIEEKGQTAGVVMQHEEPFSVDKDAKADPAVPTTKSETATSYVASKNGTKYHLLWCPGAGQIKEENKIYFASKEEAEASGYAPATNCKGI
jgi:hypothetical protein